MVGTAERQALKKAALLALDESRGALGGEVLRVRTEWEPGEIVRRTVEKHKIALAVGAALIGLGVTRFFTMPRKQRTPGSPTSMSGRLTGLAATTLWSVFHEPVLDFAKSCFASYLGRRHPSPESEKPE
jgi:hypothetical protein